MSYTIRTTAKTLIIESDGIDPHYGPNCTVQGAWVGKVTIPLRELTELEGIDGETAYEWSPDDIGLHRGSIGELFSCAAAADFRAPKGSKRYGCRKIQ